MIIRPASGPKVVALVAVPEKVPGKQRLEGSKISSLKKKK